MTENDRLTHWRMNICAGGYWTQARKQQLIERLAAYEDTGLMPDEIASWIPCKQELPENDDRVLCCTQTKTGSKNIVIGYYTGDRWVCGMNSNVIAWQPLPKVYEW